MEGLCRCVANGAGGLPGQRRTSTGARQVVSQPVAESAGPPALDGLRKSAVVRARCLRHDVRISFVRSYRRQRRLLKTLLLL